jgi:transposase
MLSHHQIRVIYDQGVEAVTATIRQLYEMIEVEDERVQRLVASAMAAHLQRTEQCSGRIAKLEEELSSRVRQVHQLNLTVKDLNKQLKEARQQTRLAREAHLATVMKNSQNSSLPPSTDRRKRTKSLREKSGRKPGGQVGHRGATKEMVEKPDHFLIYALETCEMCGSSLSASELSGSERRQVHDLPQQKIEVTEQQAQTKVCHRCGTKNKAKFPAGVNAPVQYGQRVRTAAAICWVTNCCLISDVPRR